MIKKGLLLLAITATFLAACNNYGKKKTFGKGELYYTESVTNDEAEKAGALLKKMGYLNDDRETSVQIDKADSIYKIRFVVDEEFQETDTTLDFTFKTLGFLASATVFNGKPVEIDLCDNRLTTKRTLK